MVFRPKIDVLYALSLLLAVAVPLTIVLTQPQLVTTDDVITAMVIIALCALFILFFLPKKSILSETIFLKLMIPHLSLIVSGPLECFHC